MIDVIKFIKQNADLKNADFNKKLIPTQFEIFGVRIPVLRKFAKEIEPEFIELEKITCLEEVLLYGFSAGNYKTESEQLEYLNNILPYIDNWCSCDCIISTLKKLKGNLAYEYFTNLLKSKNEFDVRVGVIGLMRNFIKSNHLPEILKNLLNCTHDGYYVKMATAWFNAELCIYDFETGKNYISKIEDKFIRNKSISKSCESFRINKENKLILKTLKIN